MGIGLRFWKFEIFGSVISIKMPRSPAEISGNIQKTVLGQYQIIATKSGGNF
jgi:hypothetical protein